MENLHLSIRPAGMNDAEAIADFSRETFLASFAADNTKEDMDKFMQEQFTRSKLIMEVGAPGNYFFIAELNDNMAGYVKLRESPSPKGLPEKPSIEIARIYSDPSLIGKGVGKLLMQTAVDFSVKLSKAVIWLGVWEHNARAINFYTHWGFTKFSAHNFILGNDVQTDLLMKKTLV